MHPAKVSGRCALIACALASALASAVPARATDFYLSKSGLDSNSGTSPAEAWRTIQRLNNELLGAGDRVFLEGGTTFNGNLYIGPDESGTPESPVIIDSYGSGRATIYAGNGNGILVYNAGGVRIQNLYVVGSGRDTNTGEGVFFYNDLPGNVKLPYVRIDRVDASKFGDYGILIGAYANTSGYRDVRITNVVASDNRMGGIFTYAAKANVHESVYIGHARAFGNSGKRGLLYNSGNGIELSGVNGGTIEYSVAHDNGWLSDAGNGPIGIWAFESTGITIQFNESYANKTGGQKDGGGFCFDQNTSNSVMQFNYSHDNAGAGYMLAHKPDNNLHTGNVIRYNVTENDARQNDYAAIHTWGRIRNAEIYNNTIYLAPHSSSVAGVPRAIFIKNSSITTQDPEHLHFHNNIIQTTGSIRLIEASASTLDAGIDIRFEGNDYFTTGASFRIVWGATTYSSLDGWRTATGQERAGTVDTGVTYEPRLVKPGQGVTFDDTAMLPGLYGYRLKADSLLIDAGRDLRGHLDPGTRDYFGGALRVNASYDIGAHEYGASCSWSIAPGSAAVDDSAGSGAVDLTATDSSCGWAAQSTVSWVSVSAGSSGSGNGRVSYSYLANPTSSARAGTIRIADQVFTLNQAANSTAPPPPPPPSGDDVVLYAAAAPVVSGAWSVVADGTAAGGSRLQNPNVNAAKIVTALAAPTNYFELTFDANAGTGYRLWIRGKATSNTYSNDSVHVQFDRSVNGSGSPIYRIGTTASAEVNIEDCSGCGLSGWGWQDNGYGVGVLGPLVYFATSGSQTIRIQVREDGLGIDQIVLSPATYLSSPPGALKNDTTILPATGGGTPPPPPPPPSGSDVVLYASEAPVVAGTWTVVADSTAAGGSRIQSPNLGAAKIVTALAAPANYFEMTFQAAAGKPYRLWVRGKAASNAYANDSVHVQFSGAVTSSGAAAYRIGTTTSAEVNIEDCSGCGLSGWGWQDNGYGVGVLGPAIYFAATGTQTVRVQVREDGLGIDQIVLSPATYLTSSPGALKNDTTVLPK